MTTNARCAIDGFLFWAGVLVLIAGIVVGQPVIAAVGGVSLVVGAVRVSLFVRGELRRIHRG
jgi:hypothetical protein